MSHESMSTSSRNPQVFHEVEVKNKKPLEALWLKGFHLMIPTGLEPATSTLSRWRSPS